MVSSSVFSSADHGSALRSREKRINTLQLGVGWLPEQPGNGLDRVYHALAQHLPGVGVGVRGLVMGSPDVASRSGGRVRAVASDTAPLPLRLLAQRRALGASDTWSNVDLVAAHFGLYAAPALDRLSDHPFVVHFHGPWAAESAVEGESGWKVRLKAALERAVYRRADRLIVLSDAFRDVLVDDYGISADRIRIVPGGVDLSRFDTGSTRRAARVRLDWPVDRPLILAVRRLVRRVGLDRLVSAMQAVRTRVPDALLLIAGTGPLRAELEHQIAAAGLARHVRLLGYVPDDDLSFAYRAANVSIVPTLALEGFGLVAVESLAAGTPVFVTPVGGLPDIVSSLSADLVLADGTPPAIADALTTALLAPETVPDAQACQDYARTHFSWSTVARRVRAVYEEVL